MRWSTRSTSPRFYEDVGATLDWIGEKGAAADAGRRNFGPDRARSRRQDPGPETLRATVDEFNVAITPESGFAETIQSGDGARTSGLAPDKTNYARPVEVDPFEGPLGGAADLLHVRRPARVDARGHVLDTDGRTITGLYAAGN